MLRNARVNVATVPIREIAVLNNVLVVAVVRPHAAALYVCVLSAFSPFIILSVLPLYIFGRFLFMHMVFFAFTRLLRR